MNSLTVKNLKYEYQKNQPILKDINLSFEEGKTYSIVGKSGSGKTTLISLLSGLEENKLSGDIFYYDQNIKEINLDTYRANYVGVVFQQYNLLNNYSIKDNLIVAKKIAGKKINEEELINILTEVGLNETFLNKKPLELSGGQQQRVAIARTLLKDTKVIIADEPTGNLDEDTEKEILDLLIKLTKKKNKTLIIVTHSNRISNTTDHVYGLNQGTINYIK